MRIVQLGDIGTRFEVNVKDQDGELMSDALAGATKMEIIFRRPNGTTFRKDAVYLQDSIIAYTTVSGDLNAVGKWKAQGYVEISGFTGHTSKIDFEVEDIIT